MPCDARVHGVKGFDHIPSLNVLHVLPMLSFPLAFSCFQPQVLPMPNVSKTLRYTHQAFLSSLLRSQVPLATRLLKLAPSILCVIYMLSLAATCP